MQLVYVDLYTSLEKITTYFFGEKRKIFFFSLSMYVFMYVCMYLSSIIYPFIYLSSTYLCTGIPVYLPNYLSLLILS
jgi:hypothetical protein